MRQVVLDTETTGLDWERGHRVIEIGCVELVNRRQSGQTFHCYLNPERDIDEGARDVHGISREDLIDKPLFQQVAHEFLDFVADAELIIHNAPFDLGFLDNELRLSGLGAQALQKNSAVLDTLVLARQIHPGQRNSLDALCKRYLIDNSRRDLHGALLDARLLAEVYLSMTGGQTALSLGDTASAGGALQTAPALRRRERLGLDLVVVAATEAELRRHEEHLDLIDRASSGKTVWRRTEAC